MTNLKLNETPIRTAKNYGINNIKLEKKKNIKIGETRGKLENLFLTIKNMLNFNLTDEEIIKYTNATQEQIDQVRKKLK